MLHSRTEFSHLIYNLLLQQDKNTVLSQKPQFKTKNSLNSLSHFGYIERKDYYPACMCSLTAVGLSACSMQLGPFLTCGPAG